MKIVAFVLALLFVAPAALAQSVTAPSVPTTSAPVASTPAPPKPASSKPERSKVASAPPSNTEQWIAMTAATFLKQRRGAYPPGLAPGKYTTVVAMIVRRDGVVTTYHLSQSSGNSAVDQAALTLVSRAGRLQPLPPDMRDQERVKLPITFHAPTNPKPPAKKKPDAA